MLIVLVTAGCAAVIVAWLAATSATFTDYRVVSGDRSCAHSDAPCARELPGRVDGPRVMASPRGPDTRMWTFVGDDGVVDDFEVSPRRDDDVLAVRSQAVIGLVRHGDVLAVATDTGLIPASGADLESVTAWLLLAIEVPGVLAAGGYYAAAKARDWGGWWTTRPNPPNYAHPWLAAWVMGPFFAYLAMLGYGAPAWLGLAIGAGFGAVLIRVMPRRP